jgi:hypothetical protein
MKRTFWLAAGFGLGLYAGERVRRTVVRLTPETFGDTVRSMVSDAIEAGKAEMNARERSLRETFAAPDRTDERPRLRLASGQAGGTARPGR